MIIEALAVRDGIRLACDLGLSNILLETDAKEVVNLWRGREQGRSEIASILTEIEELSGNLESFQLNSIGRDANEGAHLCAKQASASRRRCLWINYVPLFLVDCKGQRSAPRHDPLRSISRWCSVTQDGAQSVPAKRQNIQTSK